jgi:hypothetical protein
MGSYVNRGNRRLEERVVSELLIDDVGEMNV